MFMRAQHRLDSRRRGDVDMVDVGVGIAALILVPALIYVGGAYFMKDNSPAPTMGQAPKVVLPPLTREELDMRLAETSNILEANVAEYLKLMDQAEDPILRDHYRQWSEDSLKWVKSALGSFERSVEDPNRTDGSSLSGVSRNVRRQMAKTKLLLERVERLDILGN